MIYTVTFNPSIDYIVTIKEFKPGEVNRTEMDIKYPGGKGINVSRVLSNLNVRNKTLGFIGGFTGEYVKSFLNSANIETDFINIKGDTRINIKLKSDKETEINGLGPEIDDENLKKLFEKIEVLTSDDFLVLAGNVQKNLPKDIYSKLQERCVNKGTKTVVDTTGEYLINTLKHKPFLIKPNSAELGELFKVKIESMDDIINYASRLIDMGAQNVIISMAGEGAMLICNNGVYHATVPKGVVKNSVGAGDSLVGGFLAYYSKNLDILEGFKWGVAAGSATAFSFDLCSKEYVEELVEEVKITKVRYIQKNSKSIEVSKKSEFI